MSLYDEADEETKKHADDLIQELRKGMGMQKFWMVVGKGAPMVRHYKIEEAQAEAERICRKDKEPVFIVEAISCVSVKEAPLEWTRIYSNSDNCYVRPVPT